MRRRTRARLRARLFWERWRALIVGLVVLSAVTVAVNLWTGARESARIEQQQRDATAALRKVQADNAARLRSAQVNGCKRQNTRTIAANRNARATYAEDKLFAKAVARPQPHASRREVALTAEFHKRLLDILATLTWTPVNRDCERDPTRVELPVSFAVRAPAPADIGAKQKRRRGRREFILPPIIA